MKLKASLHIHTAEDGLEGHKIAYNVYQLIAEAKKFDFKILALTGHEYFVYLPEYGKYADEQGIKLIPGIELSIISGGNKKNHVVVLNCDSDVENVKTFLDLEKYRQNHPDIFVIAPHPNFHLGVSLGLKNLEKYITLFDAVEYSWFYTKWFNFNKASTKIAKKYNKPVIATSDLHVIDNLNKDYTLIESLDTDIKNIFLAIKQENFINISQAKTCKEIFSFFVNLF